MSLAQTLMIASLLAGLSLTSANRLASVSFQFDLHLSSDALERMTVLEVCGSQVYASLIPTLIYLCRAEVRAFAKVETTKLVVQSVSDNIRSLTSLPALVFGGCCLLISLPAVVQ